MMKKMCLVWGVAMLVGVAGEWGTGGMAFGQPPASTRDGSKSDVSKSDVSARDVSARDVSARDGSTSDVSARDGSTSDGSTRDVWNGLEVQQQGMELRIRRKEPSKEKRIVIPRLYNEVRSVHVEVGDTKVPVRILPEIATWVLSWEVSTAAGDPTIVMTLDAEAHTEPYPIREGFDGSISLFAHQGVTRTLQPEKMKLRYEPQSFKNTIGYWVSPGDYVTWEMEVESPGRFNVAILHGCGKGQRGSEVELRWRDAAEQELVRVPFEVEETGHFQNFRWRDLGTIEFESPGRVTVGVYVRKLAKTAAIDVRAIHLVRLPAEAASK